MKELATVSKRETAPTSKITKITAADSVQESAVSYKVIAKINHEQVDYFAL